MVTRQLQVERRTGKVRQSETDVLPLCHATDSLYVEIIQLLGLCTSAALEFDAASGNLSLSALARYPVGHKTLRALLTCSFRQLRG